MWVIAPPVETLDSDSIPRSNPKKNRKKKRKDRWEDDNAAIMQHAAYARGAMKWVDVRSFPTTEACVLALREAGYEIWCTDLSQRAECLRRTASPGCLPDKLAICFGSESTGASAYLLREADKRVYLPLWGFADSLNLSVAAALCIQRLFHIDPSLEGGMSERERHALRKRWYPKMARGAEKQREYAAMATRNQPALPFADTRRADEHRRGWLKKKTQKKNAAAGFKSWQLEEDEDKGRKPQTREEGGGGWAVRGK
jgi:tRNA(Leu) C34 or U34 (ribose-2'-O)-methylase TrmL